MKIVKKVKDKDKAETKVKGTGGKATVGKDKPSRYIGKTSNMRVAEYQNQTLSQNSKKKLTDEELAKDWRREFPNAKDFTGDIVRSVRNAFNRGQHNNETPSNLVHEYDDDGDKLPLPKRGRKPAASK